ncbi:MAG TPA: penicillin acylase family protein [Terriglobia bacterium]|jgi:penicillin amidase|nr:penicillin acylase family protein [Terriglobia bacterium]
MATVTASQPVETRGRNRIARAALWVLVIVLLALLALSIWSWRRVRAALPQLDGSVSVPGLAAPVQVLRDARGVPHLRAQSLEDLYFAQGYVTAQDRLWQMDLSRRLARGELAEIFGARVVERDVENRTLGFRLTAERAVDDLPPDVRSMLSAYARGVNAFIDTHRNRLPVEFTMLGYQPQPWREADSMAVGLNMAKMLNTSWQADLEREQLRGRLGPELYADLFPQNSPLEHPVAEPVAGPARAVPPEAAQAPDPAPQPALAGGGLDPVLDALESESNDGDTSGLGSNNWVVSGAHTASGKPLLSNDPHIAHSVPSVWYMIHLEAPGMDVSGVSLPGGPAVIIGHNQRIAWGMTNTGPDVQDLYVEQFNPSNPRQYLQNGQWADAEVRDEVIKVRGAADRHVTVRVTRHGPIISDHGSDREFGQGGRSLALCWTALQPHALQFPIVAMNQAQNWQEFTDAVRHFTGPEQNMVFADVDGNIGYYAPAWVPMRRNGDGSVPEPGASGDYDWIGYVPFEDLPHAYNPAGGVVATANSRVIPEGYPYFFTDAFAAPFRTARIFDLLQAGTPGRQCGAPDSPPRSACFKVDDMLKIDMDIHPLDDAWLAPALVRAAAVHPPDAADARQAIDLLRGWNGEATADSPVPLICNDTLIALRERILRPKVGEDLMHRNWSLSTIFLEKVIDQRQARWLPPGDADFDATLIGSLGEGLHRIEQRVAGRDPAAWHWGDTIPLTFHHPLDSLPLIGHYFDVGPFPEAGTTSTIKATSPAYGPSMRMVVDLSNLDGSVQNLTLGESGEISSPYYADQFQAWYTGLSFPMLFSDEAVDRGAVHRLTLEPANKGE